MKGGRLTLDRTDSTDRADTLDESSGVNPTYDGGLPLSSLQTVSFPVKLMKAFASCLVCVGPLAPKFRAK